MCETHNPRKIDKCMICLIFMLKQAGFKPIACCCGHRKYQPSLILKKIRNIKGGTKDMFIDVFSRECINRKKRFYIKDKQGYYYIPETVLPTKPLPNYQNN